MRVGLFIATWDPQINGVVTSVKELQKGLKELGVEAYIITAGRVKKPVIDGDIVYLPSKENKHWNTNSINWLSRENIDFISSLDLDIVHSHQENGIGFLASKVAKENNIPHVVTWHTCYYDYKHYALHNAFYIATIMEKIAAHKYCGKKVAGLITPSPKIGDYLKRVHKIQHEPNIIRTGLDIKRKIVKDEELLKLRESLGFEQDDFVISYIGRIAKEKNLKFLLEGQIALNSFDKHIKLMIVGDGPTLEELKKYAKRLGVSDSVVFVGRIPYKDIDKYYQISDVNTTASTTETQCLTVLEALQNGVPVCCINDSAFNYVIKDGYNGLVFSDLKGYISAMLKLKDSDLTEMRKNALKSGLECDNVSYAKKVLEVYEQVTNKKEKERH